MFKPFTGTVDELLDHVNTNINSEEVVSVVEGTSDITLTDKEVLAYLKSELGVDTQTAKDILVEMKMEEVTRIMLSLRDQGLVNIIDKKDGSEVMYELTPNGKCLIQNMKKG